MGGLPFIEHGEKDELEGLRVSAGAPFAQHLRKQDLRLDTDDLFRFRMRAVLGGRNHHVFAAAKRADGVDGPALVFKEWARDAKREVFQTESVDVRLLDRQGGLADALRDTALLQPLGGLAKTDAEHFPSVFGLRGDPFREHARLDGRDGDGLAAAGSAALTAAYVLAHEFGAALGHLGERVGQVLDDGKQHRWTDGPLGKLRVYFNPGVLNFQRKLHCLKAGRSCDWAGHSGESSRKAGIRDQGTGSREQGTDSFVARLKAVPRYTPIRN